MKLLLLRCPQCQSPLEPAQWDVVVGCRHCFTAVELDEAGLRPINVSYAAMKGVKAEQWMPFWVFNGRVHIQKRDTQGGGGSAQKDAEKLWSVSRRLYVPAWDLPMPTAREMGQKFTLEQTPLSAISRPSDAQLVAVTVTAEDALKLLEFVVLSIEAQRKDWLKNLQFKISATSTELWALPAKRQGSGWVFTLAGS